MMTQTCAGWFIFGYFVAAVPLIILWWLTNRELKDELKRKSI